MAPIDEAAYAKKVSAAGNKLSSSASVPSDSGPIKKIVTTSPSAVGFETGLTGTSESLDLQGRGRLLAQTGWNLIRSGEYSGAAHAFTQAIALVPEDASALVGLGLSQYRLSRNNDAVISLNRALTLNPDIQHAHVLLGNLALKRDDLEAAIRHYETALQQDPNDVAAQDGLFTARRQYQAEARWHRLFSPHFVVKFDASSHRIANQAIERLEQLYKEIGRKLGYYPDETIVVILYSDRLFTDMTDSPAWAGGLFDGKIHVACRTLLQDAVSVKAALAHEYAHAIVHRLSGGHAPTWLSEGLALYFEGRGTAWSRDLLARRQGEIRPLHSLHGSFLGLRHDEPAVAYAESYSAAQALIDRYGLARVRRLLATLAMTSDFAAAFEHTFQKPYRDFEAAWVAAQTDRRL